MHLEYDPSCSRWLFVTRPVKHFVLLQLQTRFPQWSTRPLISHNNETPNPNPPTLHSDPFSEITQELLANNLCGTCTFFAYTFRRQEREFGVRLFHTKVFECEWHVGWSKHLVKILLLNFKLYTVWHTQIFARSANCNQQQWSHLHKGFVQCCSSVSHCENAMHCMI